MSGSNSRGFATRPTLAASPDSLDPTTPDNQDILNNPEDDDIIELMGGDLEGQQYVEPETSWLEWKCSVKRVTDHNVIRHKPLAGTVRYDRPGVDALGDVADVAADDSDPSAGWTAGTPDFIQQVAAPSMMIRLIGGAIRCGYRINPPTMISFGGHQRL